MEYDLEHDNYFFDYNVAHRGVYQLSGEIKRKDYLKQDRHYCTKCMEYYIPMIERCPYCGEF